MTISSPPTMRPRVPRQQLYYGPLIGQGIQTVYALDPWVRRRALRGQVNPNTRERQKMIHGRYLSGLGEAPAPVDPRHDGRSTDFGGSLGDDPNYPDYELANLETADDVYGSGIFSGPGTKHGRATANANMGVFASNYSLPGYVGREVPYAVSRDISDITDDADVVMIPGGGMMYIAEDNRYVRPAVLGPTPRPPKMQTRRPPTSRYQVYSDLTNNAQQPQAALNPAAPVVPPPTYRPERTFRGRVSEVPAVPYERRVPSSPAERTMPMTNIVQPPGSYVVSMGQAPESAPPSQAQLFVWGAGIGIAVGTVGWIMTRGAA